MSILIVNREAYLNAVIGHHAVFGICIIVCSVEENIHINGNGLGAIAEHIVKELAMEELGAAVVIEENELLAAKA